MVRSSRPLLQARFNTAASRPPSIADGDTVHVQFTTQLQHGDRMEFGTSDWHNEAFGYSPVAGHRRRRVLDAEARERAIQEEAKRVAAMKRKAALEEQAAALLEAGGDEVTELFSRDWKQLHWSLDLLPQGGRPVRDGAEIRHEGRTVGHVSSGGFSPTLDAPAALGFVDSQLAEAGTQLDAIVRDRPVPLVVSNLPLVPHRYIRR